ncbi:MAG: alpha/beta fold hydrolase [Chitinophagaceae bacterium]|nr:alpha/beta fold hydrolase [Chitinophagaceae bacterium]
MAKLKTTQQLAIKYYRTKFKILTSISKRKAAEKAFELFCTPQIRNKKKLPKIFETAERLQLKVDGIIVRGWRFNHPAARKVLILHGYESSVTNFDRYVKPLINKGYEVLAFDAPANGRSDGKQITLPLYSKMIKEIHKKFGPVQSFMAHSFGGLALSLALEEINHDDNYKVALIAPASETRTAINTFFSFLKLSPDIREDFEKIIVEKGGVHSDWYSIARAMTKIKAKVLWFHDEDDDVTPLSDAIQVKEANYPNVEFVITKGLGHRRIYRDNEVVKAIVDFL